MFVISVIDDWYVNFDCEFLGIFGIKYLMIKLFFINLSV